MTWSERFVSYLRERDISDLEASHELRVGPSQIHYWRHGATAREKTRKRIERWSKGAVPAELPRSN